MRGRAGGRENNKNSDIWNTSDDALVEENEYLNFTEMLFYQLRIHLPRTVSWRLGSRCGHSSLISPHAHFILSSLCSLNFLFPYIGKALHFHPIESTSRTSSSCVAVSSKGMVSKSFVYIYTYIYSGDSGLILESAEVILQGGHVKSDFFFNLCFYTQENCTRAIPFFLYTHVNCAKWKICMWEREATLKLYESFWGALPYLSHLSVHLSHLLYFLFKVSRESKPQQLGPSLAQVAYFYPAVNALTSPFLMDQWLSWSLSLSCKHNCVGTEYILKSQPSDLLSFLFNTDIFICGGIMEKKKNQNTVEK